MLICFITEKSYHDNVKRAKKYTLIKQIGLYMYVHVYIKVLVLAKLQ